jgi:hypothetical protein
MVTITCVSSLAGKRSKNYFPGKAKSPNIGKGYFAGYLNHYGSPLYNAAEILQERRTL